MANVDMFPLMQLHPTLLKKLPKNRSSESNPRDGAVDVGYTTFALAKHARQSTYEKAVTDWTAYDPVPSSIYRLGQKVQTGAHIFSPETKILCFRFILEG